MTAKSTRKRVNKGVATAAPLPGQQRLFKSDALDMPLPGKRVSKGELSFFKDAHPVLKLHNLEEPLAWRLHLMRTTKGENELVAHSFDVEGSRYVHALTGGVAADLEKEEPSPTQYAELSGNTEFGMQTADDFEYFLSKFGGDLVGIVRVTRREGAPWNAKLSKTNLPRVLSKDAVKAGLMPPLGHSALPKSLEKTVPPEFHYWKATGLEDARSVRDALVESNFLNEECIKAVDGELRKVEVKYHLYEPATDVVATKRLTKATTLGGKIFDIIVTNPAVTTIENPFQAEDWLEALDKSDAPGTLALLSPPTTNISAREIARAVTTLKGEWMAHVEDTREARFQLGKVGVLFKVGDVAALFAASFMPKHPLVKGEQTAVLKTLQVHGLTVKIDRPVGYVQTGKDTDGAAWARTYTTDYGFIAGTDGGDGKDLDVFVGPQPASPLAFLVKQKHVDNTFDEYKLMLGFESARDARDAYLAHVPAKYFDTMGVVNLDLVKSLIGVRPTGEENLFDSAMTTAAPGAPGEIFEAPLEKHELRIARVKADGDERYVLGIVLEPDIVDSQDDTYSVEEIRQAAEKFMQHHQNMGFMHKQVVNDDVKILESYLAPTDLKLGDTLVKKGTWLMAVRVLSDKLWSTVKQGGLTGFSIGGSAVRKPLSEGV